MGVLNKLEELFTSRRRAYGIASVGSGIAYLLLVTVWFFLEEAILWAMAGYLVALPLLFWAAKRLQPHAIVVLELERQAPGFWKRNRENLLRDAVKYVFGAIIGGVIGYLIPD